MAAAHLKVYCNGVLIRKSGGNRSEVRKLKAEYDRMTADDFYKKHHAVIDEPKSIYSIKTRFYVKNNGVSRHRVTYEHFPQRIFHHPV